MRPESGGLTATRKRSVSCFFIVRPLSVGVPDPRPSVPGSHRVPPGSQKPPACGEGLRKPADDILLNTKVFQALSLGTVISREWQRKPRLMSGRREPRRVATPQDIADRATTRQSERAADRAGRPAR